jgi:hypothetical protein
MNDHLRISERSPHIKSIDCRISCPSKDIISVFYYCKISIFSRHSAATDFGRFRDGRRQAPCLADGLPWGLDILPGDHGDRGGWRPRQAETASPGRRGRRINEMRFRFAFPEWRTFFDALAGKHGYPVGAREVGV